MYARLLITLFLALSSAAPSSAQASLAGPRLFPRGARATGFQETLFDPASNHYLFRLESETGATVVEYKLPLGHAYMAAGVLRVEETTTGVVPIGGGGLSYRNTLPGPDNVGTVISAYDLAFSAATNPSHTATLLNHSLDPVTKVVTLRFRDSYLVGGSPVVSEKTYALRLVGKSLEIRATSDFALRKAAQYNHAGFAFGDGIGLAQPNLAFHVPYMDMLPVFVGADGVFVTRIVDWYVSNASEGVDDTAPSAGVRFKGETAPTYYRNDANELNAPIDETAYVTVSTDVRDVMPVIDRPPSAYRRHLADRAVSQAAPRAAYSSNAAWVSRARGLGMDDMAHIKWDWSKWPHNLNDPDTIPAAPGVPCGTIWGTPAEWLAYANAAAQANWTFAPYFFETPNDPGYHVPGFPDPVLDIVWQGNLLGQVTLTANPAFNAAASVQDAANQPKLGWNTENNLTGTNLVGQGVGHKTQVIGPHLRAGNLTPVADAIHGLNGYTPFPVAGAHTDAAAEIPDWTWIDQRKTSTFPKTVSENLKWREVSFSALKDGLDGPLFGENSHFRSKAFESYAAGLLDGTSRKVPIHWSHLQGPSNQPNKDYLVVPDFELDEVMTKATGFFGMGWEIQFNGPVVPGQPGWGFFDSFVDAWDATLLSYGHAPYFGTNGDVPNSQWDWQRNLRSYYLCHGVSKAMRTSKVQEIRYEDASGVELTLSQALVRVANGTLQLETPHLVLRFANGLEFKANHSAANWSTSVLGQSYTIPPNGFVAATPGGLLALSAINPASGVRVDYAFEPGHSEVIDQRGTPQSFNGFPGTLLPVPSGVLPSMTNDSNIVIVHDMRHQRAIYAEDMEEGSVPFGAGQAPVTLSVEIDDTSTLSLGRRRLGVRAVLTDTAGKLRDVTGLCNWSSSDPSKVKVNRFGGLNMVAAGSATITATLPASHSANRVVTATRFPVLTPVVQHATTSTKVLLSFDTDAACATSLDLKNMTTGVIVTHDGRRDPAQKTHHFAIDSLVPQTTYEATPRATNGLGLTTTGTTYTFTTP